MDKQLPVITIEDLLSLNTAGYFECVDLVDNTQQAVYCIGNSYIPDHTLTCKLPSDAARKAKVRIHVIWLSSDTAYRFSGLMVDKTDCKLYFASITPDDSDSWGSCRFEPASAEGILNMAKKYNVYLNNAVKLSLSNPEQLLDYQIYSPMSDRFYYMEIPFSDKVVLCGTGLHSNKLLAVGWLGKLLNKDFYVAYAECSLEAYEQIKQQTPSLYERGQLMEKNKPLFSFFSSFMEKRKRYPALVKILLDQQKEPVTGQSASCFYASPKGIVMQEYNGPACRWMVEFLTECRKALHNTL